MIVVSDMNNYKNDFNFIKSVFCISSLHALVASISDMCVINTQIKSLFKR